VKHNGLGGGVTISVGTGSESTHEKNVSYSHDFEQKKNMKTKSTQAIVSEFTYMPMKTFRLSESGLVMTEYAFYELQKITSIEDNILKNVDDLGKDIIKRKQALEYIRKFGSHIPFGIQTLGGLFIRKMTITTQQEESLSTLYSAASCKISECNKEASHTNIDATARVGFMGVGASGTTSTAFSSASSSGSTQTSATSYGIGSASSKMNVDFESHVTCLGPNAPTQDSLYQQLMTNNASWSVIDRGESDSYLAIWDFIEFMGQGGLLKEQCILLQEVWEEKALVNSIGASRELLALVMVDHTLKYKMYNFVMDLIACMVLKNHSSFDSALAEQFKRVVEKGRSMMGCGDNLLTPINFISTAFLAIQEEGENIMFELVENVDAYDAAKETLTNAKNMDWLNSFTYYNDTFSSAIFEKGKPDYLVQLFRECFQSADDTDCWKLVEKYLEPEMSSATDVQRSEYKRYLKNSLMFKDASIVSYDGIDTTRNHCLHYALRSNNLDLVSKVHVSCDRVANIKNFDVDTDPSSKGVEHLTPRAIVLLNDQTTSYSNLLDYAFLPATVQLKTPFIEAIQAKKWRLFKPQDSETEKNWVVMNLHLFQDYELKYKMDVTEFNLKDSGNDGIDLPQNVFLSNDNQWKGSKDVSNDVWISFESDLPINLRALKVEYDSMNDSVSSFHVQAYNDEFDRWSTVYEAHQVGRSVMHEISLGRKIVPFSLAEQSSVEDKSDAVAIEGAQIKFNCTKREMFPYWQGDLGRAVTICRIDIYNNSPGLKDRIQRFVLSIIDKNGKEVYSSFRHGEEVKDIYNVEIPNGVVGQKVNIMLPGVNRILDLSNVLVHSFAERFDEAQYYMDGLHEMTEKAETLKAKLEETKDDLTILTDMLTAVELSADEKTQSMIDIRNELNAKNIELRTALDEKTELERVTEELNSNLTKLTDMLTAVELSVDEKTQSMIDIKNELDAKDIGLRMANSKLKLIADLKAEEKVEWKWRWSRKPQEITDFINQHGPSDAHGVHGLVQWDVIHVWVRADNTRRRYKCMKGKWNLQAAKDGYWSNKGFIGLSQKESMSGNNYDAYWVQNEDGSIDEGRDQRYEYCHSTDMSVIENFINEKGPHTIQRITGGAHIIQRITGGVSVPNFHVWVKPDGDKSKKYRFVLGNWVEGSEHWHGRCVIGCKSPPQPHAYYVETVY